jgi:hypothetical protein
MIDFNIVDNGEIVNVQIFYLKHRVEKIQVYGFYDNGFWDLKSDYFVYIPDEFVRVDENNIPHISNSKDQLMLGNAPNIPLIERLYVLAKSEDKIQVIDDKNVALYIYDKFLYSQNIFFDPKTRNEWVLINPDEVDEEIPIDKILKNGYNLEH